jgi:AraC-like DNA-binding protein
MLTADRKYPAWLPIDDRQTAPLVPEPRVISAHCHSFQESDASSWHSHPFAELTLITEAPCRIGIAGTQTMTEVNSLFLHQPGERHGAWSIGRRAPCLWELHFVIDASLMPVFGNLADRRSAPRAWNLNSDQSTSFKWMFLEIARERARQQDHYNLAQSSWLKLLLVSVERWVAGDEMVLHGRDAIRPELQRLWQLVHAASEDSVESLRQICRQPNYDSLRHGFRKAFGCSPREMILRLKMQRAQGLLAETGLSIKEIASRCGYARQHEFARAFHQRIGLAPSQWRCHPPKSPSGLPFVVSPTTESTRRNVKSTAI